MKLVDGISHIATVTDDLDRMVGFYQRVFDAEVSEVMEEEGLRHQFVFLGDQVCLHPFQLSWAQPDHRFEMFDRGRLDHFGLTAPTVDALLEIRDRLLAERDGDGATDAQIRDFGGLYSLHYQDPDGVQLEVNLFKDNWTELEMLKPRGLDDRRPGTHPSLNRSQGAALALHPRGLAMTNGVRHHSSRFGAGDGAAFRDAAVARRHVHNASPEFSGLSGTVTCPLPS